ncbi:MAG TPA: prenyltransferase/squalene oxidase repeat-containing protein [Actinomycetota bacterium]
MEDWKRALRGDPVPWLLEEDDPAVRHLALRLLLDEPADAPRVRRARAAAMKVHPIASILEHQDPEGFWDKPGAGYGRKYTGTVWSLIFLDQLGADGRDRRVRKACEYVLSHTQTESGGFGASGSVSERPPPPSAVVHCLHGNLLRAMLGFGWLDDERVARAIEWQAGSITGERFDAYYRSGTSGQGFRCVANGHEPCAWGAIKALRALARVPGSHRSSSVAAAIERGVRFLLSRDPAVADYPAASTVSGSWFKLGFPSGYVADVLQNLEVLVELGRANDPRLSKALDLVLSKQDGRGRWRNEYAYNGKTWGDIERKGTASKWVTLRACSVVRSALA